MITDPHETQAQFDREVAEYAFMDQLAEEQCLSPVTEDHCGCCGGPGSRPPKGQHAECCASLHDTPAPAPAAVSYDRELIARARAIAAAKTAADVRTAITAAYPAHAPAMAELDDSMTWVYANGVMAQLMTELASGYERELNRNA